MEPPYKKFAHGLRVQLGKTRDQDAEAIDADAHAADYDHPDDHVEDNDHVGDIAFFRWF